MEIKWKDSIEMAETNIPFLFITSNNRAIFYKHKKIRHHLNYNQTSIIDAVRDILPWQRCEQDEGKNDTLAE